MNRRLGIATAIVVALCAPAVAQDKKKTTYDVQVWAIRATNANKDISKELKPIAKQLRRTGFTGFKLEKKAGGKVEEGKPYSGKLIEGYEVKLTPISTTKGRIKLKTEVSQRVGKKTEPKLNTTVTISSGRFQLHTGLKLKGNDELIIAVSAR